MRKLLLAAAALALAPVAASAVTISLAPSNSGIGSIAVVVDDVAGTITITENWTGTGPGNLLFEDFDQPYTIIKNITNNSGVAWTRLANELLDIAGDGDDGLDPQPYPGNVPVGYTTSNDSDGLTFADPRSSTVFLSTFVDEVTDARDFTDFFGGVLANGGLDTVTYFLFNLGNDGDFILQQRPNASSIVPAPGVFALFGLAALALATSRRRAR